MHSYNSPRGGWSHPTLQKRTQTWKHGRIAQGPMTAGIPAHNCGALLGRPFLGPRLTVKSRVAAGAPNLTKPPLLREALLGLPSPPDLPQGVLMGLTAHYSLLSWLPQASWETELPLLGLSFPSGVCREFPVGGFQ